MIWVPFLLAIPGAISVTMALSRISPWEFNNRITPLVMVLACLLLMICPPVIEMAFAAATIAGLLANWLGFDFTGHEAANWSWVRAVAQKTVTSLRRVTPTPVTNFLTREYPVPGEVAVAPVAPVTRSRSPIPKYVPDL